MYELNETHYKNRQPSPNQYEFRVNNKIYYKKTLKRAIEKIVMEERSLEKVKTRHSFELSSKLNPCTQKENKSNSD